MSFAMRVGELLHERLQRKGAGGFGDSGRGVVVLDEEGHGC